jgi:hypothetical protein
LESRFQELLLREVEDWILVRMDLFGADGESHRHDDQERSEDTDDPVECVDEAHSRGDEETTWKKRRSMRSIPMTKAMKATYRYQGPTFLTSRRVPDAKQPTEGQGCIFEHQG